ncbi:MAG: hypothetical protein MJ090_05350 [Clostridia bacterium]|nr:hypothetical protein [Clostridia bacterium]
MTLTILLIILFVFAIIGLTEFIHSLAYSLISSQLDKTAVVIKLCEKTATEQLQAVLFEHNWFGSSYAKRVIAVFDDLSQETLDLCNDLARETDIIIVPTESVKNVIKSVF